MSKDLNITGQTFKQFINSTDADVIERPSPKDNTIINAFIVGDMVFYLPKAQQGTMGALDYKSLGALSIIKSKNSDNYFLGTDRSVVKSKF